LYFARLPEKDIVAVAAAKKSNSYNEKVIKNYTRKVYHEEDNTL